jgi:hypothetical protein
VKRLTLQGDSGCYFTWGQFVPSPQEAEMTTRKPRLLRWTEETEAAQVRALATFEREPESAAVRPVATVPQPLSARQRLTVLPWLLSWFGAPDPQIGETTISRTNYDHAQLS